MANELSPVFVQARNAAKLPEPTDVRQKAAELLLRRLSDEAKRVGCNAACNFVDPCKVSSERIYLRLGGTRADGGRVAAYLICRDGEIRIGSRAESAGELTKDLIWQDATPVRSVCWNAAISDWSGPGEDSATKPLAQELVDLFVTKLEGR